jgi:hypothetical protein
LVDSRDVARRNRLHRLCGLGSSGQNYSGYRRRGSFAFYLESGGKMKPTVLKDCIHC